MCVQRHRESRGIGFTSVSIDIEDGGWFNGFVAGVIFISMLPIKWSYSGCGCSSRKGALMKNILFNTRDVFL